MSRPVALVTGGASGLGLATARRLITEGHTVFALDLNEEKGAANADELGESYRFVKTDVTSEADVTAAIEAAKAEGDIRVAVSCAGVGWPGRVIGRDGTPHDLGLFQKVIAINLVGTFNVLRLAAHAMAGNEPDEHGQRGVIINTASVAAYEGQIGQIAYSASKGGVVGMTIPAARDLASKRIRVLTIAPGIFKTPMVAGLPQKVQDALAASIPNPSRLGAPEEYADLVFHIAQSPYLNGETIRIDGAVRLAPR
jgi:NAD(P)-dependent dehydrogenase (short-subunit alcohol dehydrogenase family)